MSLATHTMCGGMRMPLICNFIPLRETEGTVVGCHIMVSSPSWRNAYQKKGFRDWQRNKLPVIDCFGWLNSFRLRLTRLSPPRNDRHGLLSRESVEREKQIELGVAQKQVSPSRDLYLSPITALFKFIEYKDCIQLLVASVMACSQPS